jgi:glutathione synthase/RimK-type ligase-like ATP-grasp enzyme
MSTIFIVGAATDPEAKRVAVRTRALGGRVVRCDTLAFPANTHLTFRDGQAYLGRMKAPLPRTVYLRGLHSAPLRPEYEEDLATRPRGLLAQCDEKNGMLTSLLLTLERRGAVLVNSLQANEQHSRKPYQLELLRAAGLPVPRSLATNDPGAVRRFVREVGQAVYKPISGGATVREVEPDDLTDERLSALAVAPVLFQELIHGVSVRAYVVGKRVVAAAELHSTELDYRRQEDAVVPTRLSPTERRAALAAAQACGMHLAGVDLIRSAEGFRLIECNPSPMFAVFEKKTGLDVATPLARLLLRVRRT